MWFGSWRRNVCVYTNSIDDQLLRSLEKSLFSYPLFSQFSNRHARDTAQQARSDAERS